MPLYLQTVPNGKEADEVLFAVTVEDLIAACGQAAADPDNADLELKPWTELTDPEKEAIIKAARKAFEPDLITQDWIDGTLRQAIGQDASR